MYHDNNFNDHEPALLENYEDYKKMYEESIDRPDIFLSRLSKMFYWKVQPIDHKYSYNFDPRRGPAFVEYLSGAQTNICYNVLDRVIDNGFGSVTAYHWQSNDCSTERHITYSELRSEVSKFANALRGLGVERGDTIAVYMPVTIDTAVAMLACARIGAVHMSVFAGLSSQALAERLMITKCKVLVTVNCAYRRDKVVDFRNICIDAIGICAARDHNVAAMIVKKHDVGFDSTGTCNIELDWDDLLFQSLDQCEPAWVDAEHPLFMICTSGTTGTPKCIVHTTGGLMLWAYLQSKYLFSLEAKQVFLSTADLAWVVGHIYSVYGPLSNACTTVLMEGSPLYPCCYRVWQLIEKYRVSRVLTAPTVVRSLMKMAADLSCYDLTSLKVIGIGGEPINQDAWSWLWNEVGRRQCYIANVYGQTEIAGGIFIDYPGCSAIKPCASGLPFFCIKPVILNENGEQLDGVCHGYLAIKDPFPGIVRTLYNDHDKYTITYFSHYPGYYYCGDAVSRDEDGYYWVTNRVDDMIKVSASMVSPYEVENIVLQHPAITDCALVPAPDPLKGNSLHLYVVLANGFDDSLEIEIKEHVTNKIGVLSRPDVVHVISALPKNNTGKILRRYLSKVCHGDFDFGDTSNMDNASVLDELSSIKH